MSHTPVGAAFSAIPTQGIYPLTVSFTDLSTGDYDTATWNFGDGTDAVVVSLPVRTVVHVFTKKGDFTVSLKATGKGGVDEEIKTGFISVSKAVSAALRRTPSGPSPANEPSVLLSLGLSLATDGRLTPIRGGLPLMVEGQCVGAIGVSGGSEDEDVQVAQAGVDALAGIA